MGKNIYVGGAANTTTSVSIETINDVYRYFSVSGTLETSGSSSFTISNRVDGSMLVRTILTARQDIDDVYFNYSYSSESGGVFDLIVAGSSIEPSSSSSGVIAGHYSGAVSAGESIVFQCTKNSSSEYHDDVCTISDMFIEVVMSNVARKVVKPYIGVSNVARSITNGYIGVDGVARVFFESVPVWGKYSCSTSTYYVQEYPGTTLYISRSVSQGSGLRYYYNYSFNKYSGFSSSSYSTTSPITQGETDQYQISDEIAGRYDVGTTAVYRYESVNSMTYNADGSVKLSIRATLVTKAQQATQYYRGGVSYGTVTATEDEMQSLGTIIEGSYADGYYVIQEGSTYYYYVLGG